MPKVNNVEELREIEGTLSELEGERGLERIHMIPSIESAEAVLNTAQIAAFSKRIPAVGFGVFDLLNDMGVEPAEDADPGVPDAAWLPRSWVPLAARAAGTVAIDAIWQDLGDAEGLERDCKTGRRLGYVGKSVIHPGQIPVVHDLFRPGKHEILWAQKVCRSYEESVEKGIGATKVDGRMIDEVHYKQAKAVLGLASESG